MSWEQEQERELRIAARTRERPIIRKQVKILLEIKGWNLLELWLDMKANPSRYGSSLRKQTRLMFYQRRLRALREQDNCFNYP